MSWKSILPKGVDINNLSLDECRNFKKFYDMLTQQINGPKGFKVFYKFLHHLVFFTNCCIQDKKFPALNNCWDDLYPLFGTSEFDNEWFFFCWICCDFPLELNSNRTIIDEFNDFTLSNTGLTEQEKEHYKNFHLVMKSSRLGLYQERISTTKITKFRELFTGSVISTIRSVPEYDHGEIFLTRIISYLGDNFQIHDPRCYPSQYKDHVKSMVENKLFYISETGSDEQDYLKFMKLAGPYWMSCTHPDQNIAILNPDHYLSYYRDKR